MQHVTTIKSLAISTVSIDKVDLLSVISLDSPVDLLLYMTAWQPLRTAIKSDFTE
jgi:hypothetical protein